MDNDQEDDDVPRFLTSNEIESFLENIPLPHAVTKSKAEFARRQLVKILRADLRTIEICPSGVQEYIDRTVIQFEQSRIKPGAMVGFTAAEAPSMRFQQDTLSATHSAGKAGMRGSGSAVERFTELVTKQQTKNPSPSDKCNVFFKSIQTQHSILRDRRTEMVAINLSAILNVDKLPAISYVSAFFATENGGVEIPSWYALYSKIYDVPIPPLDRPSTKILRIYLSIEKIVEYRITVSEIRKTLLSAGSNVLRFFVSPTSLGLIDVWALDEEFHTYGMDMSGDVELDVFNCLQSFEASELQNLYIKGIPGIRDVEPAKVDIWGVMTLGQSHRKLNANTYEYSLSSMWPMLFDWERPELLWDFLDITLVDKDDKDKEWVILDGGAGRDPPHEIIKKAIAEDETEARNYQRKAVETGDVIVTRPTTPENVTYWSQLWYAKTEGTNLREIIIRDDVDPRFTISNRPYEVLELFGIVAARRVMLEELYGAFGGGRGEPVYSMRHFALLADFVCHTGTIKPVSNLSIQGRSTLSKATFSKQFNTLVSPAIFGVDEAIGDVSASIMIATRARIGPRAFEYEGGANEGVSAEEIKTRLRTSAASSSEVDKIVATLTDTSADDIPLYTVENGVNLETGEGGDEDDLVEEERFEPPEVAAYPPGLVGKRGAGDAVDEMIIVDDDADEDFIIPTAAAEAPQPSKKRAAVVAMAPALRSAINKMGGTIVDTPPTTIASSSSSCLPVPSRKRTGGSKRLKFVDDD